MWTKKDCVEAAARGEGCLGKAADDEPVFILRGQDAVMAGTIKFWADRVKELNGDTDNAKSAAAREFIDEILQWQVQHRCKMPD